MGELFNRLAYHKCRSRHKKALTTIIVDVVSAVGLELVLAGVPLEPAVALAVPSDVALHLPRGAVSVAVATIFTTLKM